MNVSIALAPILGSIERHKTMIFFGLLVLFIFIATAKATDLTTCGTYWDNNTVYEIPDNVTSTAAAHCFVLNGDNVTVNGQWSTIHLNDSSWAAFYINGTNISITDVSVQCNNASATNSAGLRVGPYARGTSSKNMDINGCYYAILCSSTSTIATNHALTAMNINGSLYRGVLLSSGCVNNTFTFTNINIHNTVGGGNFDINPNAAVPTPIDGGYNFWTTCTGQCSWYNFLQSSGYSDCWQTTYAPATLPNNNYGQSNFAPANSITNKTFWFRCRDVAVPPANRPVASNMSWYMSRVAGTITEQLNLYNIYADWDENTLTFNNLPARNTTSSFAWVAPVINPSVQQVITPNFIARGSHNQERFADYAGLNYYGVWGNLVSDQDANPNGYQMCMDEYATISQRPRYQMTYYHNFYYGLNTVKGYNTSGRIYSRVGVALDSATRCSTKAPQNWRYGAVIYSLNPFGGALTEITTKRIDNAENFDFTNGQYWTTWNCTGNSMYYVEDVRPYFKAVAGSICPSGMARAALYNIVNETTGTPVGGNATITGTGTAYVSGAWHDVSYTESVQNTNNFSVCINSMVTNYTMEFFAVTYSNATSYYRNYYLRATEATNTTITIFMLDSSLSSAIKFVTKDQYDAPLVGRLQHYLRYYPINNTYALVAMGVTDSNGEYVANLYTNGTTFYKIISFAADNETVEKTFNSESVTCTIGQSCTHTLLINTQTELPDYWNTIYGALVSNCTFNQTSKTIACTYADSSGESHYFDLNASRVGFGYPVSVCNSTSTSASGTLLCTIPDSNLTGNVYSWSLTRHSNSYTMQGGMLDFRDVVFRQLGAGIAFLVVLVVGFLALFNPIAAVLVGAVGLFAINLLGLLDLEVTSVAGVIIVAIILAIGFNRRQ